MDFIKVVKNSCVRFDVEFIDVFVMVNLNDLYGSIRSLVEVKILSDKIIVFCVGIDFKIRVLSVDSVSVSGLRWDRLLVNSNYFSSEEFEFNSLWSCGSLFEIVDYVKKLGLKIGDLLWVKCMCSSSSGNFLIDNVGFKKIFNRNMLYGLSDNFMVVFGDICWNLSVSFEVVLYMSLCDVFGYMVFSMLRC